MYEDNIRSGQGIMSYPDGSTYSGMWVLSWKHGLGVFTEANGSTYHGQWIKGYKSKGTLRSANGDIYEGDFKDD